MWTWISKCQERPGLLFSVVLDILSNIFNLIILLTFLKVFFFFLEFHRVSIFFLSRLPQIRPLNKFGEHFYEP